MALLIESVSVPVKEDADGVFRVGGTRVTLDTVVSCFEDGATVEEIVGRYPSLQVPDVYAVVAFYLTHRDAVAAYLLEREKLGLQVRAEVERRSPSRGIRDRLLARQGGTPAH